MATEPRESGDNPASKDPGVPIRHQQDHSKTADDDASAAEAASQQQQ